MARLRDVQAHKRRGVGRAVKDPLAVARKLGKRKRLRRSDLGR
jgi:hypothetical protein